MQQSMKCRESPRRSLSKAIFAILATFFLAAHPGALAGDRVGVFPSVSRLAPSGHYKVRIRPAQEGVEWLDAFARETAC